MSDRLPAGWSKPCLSDIAELQLGKMLDRAKNFTGQSMPYLRNVNIRWGSIETGDLYNMRFTDAEATRFSVRDGDVLVCEGGEPGRCAIWQGGPTSLKFQKAIHRIRPSGRVLSGWIALFLRHEALHDRLAGHFTGTTIKHLPAQALAAIRLPVPPLAEQRRIVARIEALSARTRRARADLERIAPLCRRHRDRTLANAFDIGKSTLVAELASAVFDGPFGSNLKSDDYTASGTRVVRLENIGHLRFIGDKETFITDEKADGLRRHHLHPDDVLFSSFIDKEVRVCLFPPGQPTNAINKADCFCVRVDPKRADPRYVALRLASPVTYDDMRDAVHGATRPRIGITDLKQYVINAPSVAEQTSIADRVERQHGMSNTIHREATRALALLDRLEQSILARAFRGELVPVHLSDTVPDAAPVSASPTSVSPRRLQRVSA